MMCRLILLHGILLSLLFTVKAQGAESLTISKVLNLGTNEFSITFTTNYGAMATVIAYDLILFMNAEQWNFYAGAATDNTDSYTLNFPDQLPIPDMHEKEVILKLSGFQNADTKVIEGSTTIGSFPVQPDTPDIQIAKYPNNNHIVLITSISLGGYDMLDPEPTGTKVKDDTVIYYLDEASPANEYSLCFKNTDNALICTATKTGISIPPDDLTLGTIKSATLTYNVLPLLCEIGVEMDGGDTRIDVVIPDQKICHSESLTTSCNTQLADSIGMRIIGFDGSDVMVSYKEHTITDYHLKGEVLSASTIEVRWDFQNSMTQYLIKRTPTDGDFDSATVNCNPGQQGVPCFGYFTGLTGGEEYTITVQPSTGNSAADNTNIIELVPITPNFKYSGLQIRFHHLGWHRNGLILNSKVCFNHISHSKESVFSHYEFVLISKQGQWLKQKLMTQYAEEDICFTPFAIHTQKFDVNEGATLIVTQRAKDGFTVLASGETKVAFDLNS